MTWTHAVEGERLLPAQIRIAYREFGSPSAEASSAIVHLSKAVAACFTGMFIAGVLAFVRREAFQPAQRTFWNVVIVTSVVLGV